MDLGDITGGIGFSQSGGWGANIGFRIPLHLLLIILVSIPAVLFAFSSRNVNSDIVITDFEVDEDEKWFSKDTEIVITAKINNFRSEGVKIQVVLNLSENGELIESRNKDHSIEGKNSQEMKEVFEAKDDKDYDIEVEFFEIVENGNMTYLILRTEHVKT